MRKFVGVNMNEEIWEGLKKYVRNKHGKIHTVLGQELEEAIKEYLFSKQEYEHTHTHIEEGKQDDQGRKQDRSKSEAAYAEVAYANAGESENVPRGERTKRKIVQHLKNSGMMTATSVSENAVKRIIAQIAGHDKRTIDKYFCILEKEWLLPENMGKILTSPHD